MAFAITYRDPRHPDVAGTSIVRGELEAKETIERLGREGYEVTGITPPLEKHTLFQRPKPR